MSLSRRRPKSSSYWFIGITEQARERAPDPTTRPGPGSRVATSIPKGWKRASVPVGVPGTGSGSLPGHWLFMKPRSKLRDTTKRYRDRSSYRLSGSYFNEYARLSAPRLSRARSRNVTDESPIRAPPMWKTDVRYVYVIYVYTRTRERLSSGDRFSAEIILPKRTEKQRRRGCDLMRRKRRFRVILQLRETVPRVIMITCREITES